MTDYKLIAIFSFIFPHVFFLAFINVKKHIFRINTCVTHNICTILKEEKSEISKSTIRC